MNRSKNEENSQATPDAHPVLGRLDQLHVEPTDVVSGEDAERVYGNAVISRY